MKTKTEKVKSAIVAKVILRYEGDYSCSLGNIDLQVDPEKYPEVYDLFWDLFETFFEDAYYMYYDVSKKRIPIDKICTYKIEEVLECFYDWITTGDYAEEYDDQDKEFLKVIAKYYPKNSEVYKNVKQFMS